MVFMNSVMSTEKKEKKEINKLSLLIVAIIVLIIIVGGAAYYIFRQQAQMKELVEGYELDKEMLADEYNEISLTYENIKFEFNNDSLVAQLATEQEKVKRLQEELRTVRATDTRRINELKKQLETLRSIMRTYVAQIDSLNTENTKLKEENKKVTTRYRQATTQAANLQKEKEQLAERVTLASKLDATNIQVNPVNRKGKTVKKIKQMEQFVVSFLITKNITASVGEKTIYVRIMKPDDDVLVKSRGDTFEFEGKHINYSMKRIIEYAGEEASVTMYWDIEEFLSPGTYYVDIFADGNHIGRKSFTLDN
ncbi:myosin heavy subunit [Parabacteroides sp. PFB2-12]|nr:myosin heavy subunit [Parabacteroides sp. PM6-13]MDH6392090.1 myosin heavy subunit [Parabacteroides sp. PFB2-12]